MEYRINNKKVTFEEFTSTDHFNKKEARVIRSIDYSASLQISFGDFFDMSPDAYRSAIFLNNSTNIQQALEEFRLLSTQLTEMYVLALYFLRGEIEIFDFSFCKLIIETLFSTCIIKHCFCDINHKEYPSFYINPYSLKILSMGINLWTTNRIDRIYDSIDWGVKLLKYYDLDNITISTEFPLPQSTIDSATEYLIDQPFKIKISNNRIILCIS